MIPINHQMFAGDASKPLLPSHLTPPRDGRKPARLGVAFPLCDARHAANNPAFCAATPALFAAHSP